MLLININMDYNCFMDETKTDRQPNIKKQIEKIEKILIPASVK